MCCCCSPLHPRVSCPRLFPWDPRLMRAWHNRERISAVAWTRGRRQAMVAAMASNALPRAVVATRLRRTRRCCIGVPYGFSALAIQLLLCHHGLVLWLSSWCCAFQVTVRRKLWLFNGCHGVIDATIRSRVLWLFSGCHAVIQVTVWRSRISSQVTVWMRRRNGVATTIRDTRQHTKGHRHDVECA